MSVDPLGLQALQPRHQSVPHRPFNPSIARVATSGIAFELGQPSFEVLDREGFRSVIQEALSAALPHRCRRDRVRHQLKQHCGGGPSVLLDASVDLLDHLAAGLQILRLELRQPQPAA
jgi:hypothetical protein